MKLLRNAMSGHSHRVELMLSILGLDYSRVDINLKEGEHKQEPFISYNVFSQIPVLLDEGKVIPDSNAILVYLCEQYDHSGQWWPKDAFLRASIQRFLSLAAGKLAQGPAIARAINRFQLPLDKEQAIQLSHQLFQPFNRHLEGRVWLVGEQATIADLAMYTYIKLAPEGDIDMETYPHINQWLASVEQLPGFLPMYS